MFINKYQRYEKNRQELKFIVSNTEKRGHYASEKIFPSIQGATCSGKISLSLNKKVGVNIRRNIMCFFQTS